ncbi:MAG: hypothetical protein SGILL_010404, partial [Bacillariaceae sp.]
ESRKKEVPIQQQAIMKLSFQQQRQVFEETRDEEAAKAEAVALSTIVDQNDGSRNLYEECKVMSELSSLIYVVAYMLDTIGKGGYKEEQETSGWFSWWNRSPPKLKQLDRLELVLSDECFDGDRNLVIEEKDGDTSTTDYLAKLNRNLSATAILEFIKANEVALSKDQEITGDVPTNNQDRVSPEANIVLEAIASVKVHKEGNYVWTMDHHFGSTDLVYAITVNRQLKRVTIGFRGSVTGHDWYQNIQVNLRTLQTPDLLKEQLKFDEEIKVHLGFKKYLLDDELNNAGMTMQEMQENETGKYGQILRDLNDCFNYKDASGKQIHKDFHLYVTGHSLGGALSTLLAMKLASSWTLANVVKVRKPIVNISVASPYVGNQGWANAVKRLEDEGWLRHVRITNQGDVVPVGPPKYFLYNKVDAVYGEPYVHTGCNVHLTGDDKDPLDIGFDKVRSVASQFSFSAGQRHKVSDYWMRQRDGKGDLEKKTIEGLYEEKKKESDEATKEEEGS